MRYSKIVFFSFIIAFTFFATRCDNEDEFEFPTVYMNASINIYTDAEFMSLSQPGVAMDIIYHPNGDATIGYDNNGIIIYNNGDMFYAFDKTCPHDLPNSFAVSSDGSLATCPECGSVFVLPSEGQPSVGSASKYFLKSYRTSFNINTGELIITN